MNPALFDLGAALFMVAVAVCLVVWFSRYRAAGAQSEGQNAGRSFAGGMEFERFALLKRAGELCFCRGVRTVTSFEEFEALARDSFFPFTRVVF